MGYMLIFVQNREIITETFDTFEQAQQQMKKEYNEAIKDEYRVDESEIDNDSAWANIDDNDYELDWAIVEI